jgi:hypothetical protein
MKPLVAADILPIAEFKAVRGRLERELLEVKAARRIALGEHMSLLFENRETCRWQIQEMCRVEGITAPTAVQHELDTYNALLPGRGELSATLLIEYVRPAEREVALRGLVGLHEHLWLEIARQEPIHGRLDVEQFSDERISSVQFLRFNLNEAQIIAFHDHRVEAAITCTHPAYPARAVLRGASRGALAEDLASTLD